MIVTDGLRVVSTTSLEELHDWAQENGIRRSWFRGTRKGYPHYQIPYKKLGMARKIRKVKRQELLVWAKEVPKWDKPKEVS
jgi:hypothetical protein